MTFSSDFPVVGAIGGPRGIDAFLFVLDLEADQPWDSLLHSSLIGGASLEEASGLAVVNNDVIVAGVSVSEDLPVTSGVIKQEKSGWADAFVARFELAIDESVSFLRGDCTGDAEVNISDATCVLDWLFGESGEPDCLAAVNTNGDGTINVADAVFLLNFLFAGGPRLSNPYPECGPGTLPSDERLGCATPPDCQ